MDGRQLIERIDELESQAAWAELVNIGAVELNGSTKDQDLSKALFKVAISLVNNQNYLWAVLIAKNLEPLERTQGLSVVGTAARTEGKFGTAIWAMRECLATDLSEIADTHPQRELIDYYQGESKRDLRRIVGRNHFVAAKPLSLRHKARAAASLPISNRTRREFFASAELNEALLGDPHLNRFNDLVNGRRKVQILNLR